MKWMLAVLTVALVGCSNAQEDLEIKAYEAVVSDSKYGTGEQAVKDAGQDEVIADIKELCDNLPKHEYRSDASNATKFKYSGIGYELAIASGAQVLCSDAWYKGKLMN